MAAVGRRVKYWQGRRVFFFEKKNQKTCDFRDFAGPRAYAKGQKFLLLFSKRSASLLT
jgi:hypothetical protein